MGVARITRNMTQDERTTIEKFGVLHPPGYQELVGGLCFALVSGAFVFAVLSAITWLVIEPFLFDVTPIAYLSVVVGGSCSATLLVTLKCVKDCRSSRDDPARKEIVEEVDGGVVEVVRVKATEAAVILEREDEGRKYCYRTGADACVLLREIDVIDPSNFRECLNDHIELIRLPHSKLILRVHCHGNALAPVAELQPDTDRGEIHSGEVLSTDWSTVLAGKAMF